MRPPICAVCGKNFSHSISKGGLVLFTLSESDKEFNKRFEEPGFVGHEAGMDWFCSKHIKLAKKYKHVTLSEALAIIKGS